ncbi:MAG: WXG100 family type VII secretion target [Lachnospiraceae bacterium]|nr:WXG100 family type VII secretion target [Lachnospiraceae bacterium]
MSTNIDHDYQAALNRAQELEDSADRLKKKIERLELVQSNLLSCWEGSSADEMQKKVTKMIDLLNDKQSNARSIANSIRVISTAWYEAEKRAQELMEARRKLLENAQKITGH